MNRADYEATLRVVVNPTAADQYGTEHNESMYDMEGDPLGEIGMINKFNDFLDRSGFIVNRFNFVKRDSIDKL